MKSDVFHYRDLNGGRLPTSALQFMFVLLWQRFRWRTLALVLTSVVSVGLMSVEPLFLRELINAVRATGAATGWNHSVTLPFLLIAGAWVLSAGFSRLFDVVDLRLSPQLRLETQSILFTYLIDHAPQFFHENLSGRLAQKVKQAGQATVALIGIIFQGIVRLIAATVIGIAIVAPATPLFTWLLLGWTVSFLALSAQLSRRCLGLSRAYSEEVSASTGVMVDVVTNVEIIRAFARGPFECARLVGILGRECSASKRLRWNLTVTWLLLFNALLAFQISFVGLALNEVVHGRMGVGDLVMVFSLSAILGNNVWSLSTRMMDLFEQIGILQSTLGTVLVPHAITDRPKAERLKVTKGEIVFDRVTFSYANSTPLFEDLSLTIRPGEKVGLVGPSGSGKSTLVRLLRRYYDPQSGRILIDGQDISAISLMSLNEAIAEVPQEPSLFHRTLKDNVRYANLEASDAELKTAAALANCTEFIAERMDGFGSVVGERGVRLSAGERQRVAIARAFLRNAQILILDEATSALDSITETIIRDSLWKLFEGRTVIAIAHRLSTISQMDRILYLEHGRIVEDAPPDSLRRAKSRYLRLWQQQVDGFVDKQFLTVTK